MILKTLALVLLVAVAGVLLVAARRPDHSLAETYGAWREKNMYGKKSMGVQRSTYLIDGAGVVARVWKRVQVEGHDEQVLAALRELAG